MRNINRKINIIYKRATRSFKKSCQNLLEEIFVILRNRNYYKKHPDIFAIFSIIEQEQNTRIFELQKANFRRIKNNILQDREISDHAILEGIRGLFQNNNLDNKSSKIKKDIAEFLFEKSQKIITKNDIYYFPLLKIVIFAFPFLLNHKDYKLTKNILKRKSSNSLKLLKDIFEQYHNNDFLIEFSDIKQLIILAIEFDNKPSFMLFVRFLRRKKKVDLILTDDFIKRTKILTKIHRGEKGFDYLAILLSYLDNEHLTNILQNDIELLFLQIFTSSMIPEEKARKYNKLHSYISLNNKVGTNNSRILLILKKYAKNCEFGNFKTRSQISRIKKLQKSLFKIKLQTRADVEIKSVVNLANQHSEEFWLVQFSPYLL